VSYNGDGTGGYMIRDKTGDGKNSQEDARLAAAGALDVTLYTRPGCHLCEEAKSVMAPLLAEFGARLREVNIDEDAVLRERHGCDVPVIFLGTRKIAKHRVAAEQFRRRLAEARG
jgi:glutaredoxin